MHGLAIAIGLLTLGTLSACAPDRSGSRLVVGEHHYAVSAQRPLGALLHFAGPDSLRLLYIRELEKAGVYRFTEENPTRTDLENAVQLSIRIDARGSASLIPWWHPGLASAGPVWPLIPYRSATELELHAELRRNGSLMKTIHLIESGEQFLPFYTPFHQAMVQREVDWRHRVLAARFAAELKQAEMEPHPENHP